MNKMFTKARLLLPTVVWALNACGQNPTEESRRLDDLFAFYSELRLPLPPTDATLVQLPTGWSSKLEGKDEPILLVGFQLNTGASSAAEILAGPFHLSAEHGAPLPLASDATLTSAISCEIRDVPFSADVSLSLAAQCHARGDRKLALAILERRMANLDSGQGPVAVATAGGPWMQHRPPATQEAHPTDNARTVLAGEAWNYWLNETVRPGSDWNAVARAMSEILSKVPALENEQNRSLLRSVEAALVPSRAKPDSVEADIDNLIHCAMESGTLSSDKTDAVYNKVLYRGFEAVPALIEHLNDIRLTRSVMTGFNNFPTMPRRLGEIAADLLQAIAGEELSRDWLRKQLGNSLSKEIAQKWWAGAQKIDERQYLRDHVLPHDTEAEWPNSGQLAIIARRYPELLPSIYEEALKRGGRMQTYPITDAIEESSRTRETKIAALRTGADSKRLALQIPAIRNLQKLAPEIANAKFLDILTQPIRSPKKSVWTSDEATLSHLVIGSDSPAVWEAFSVAAKKAHVSLRLEWMNPMDYTNYEGTHRKERLQFLAQFLEDNTQRTIQESDKLYDGPCAAFTFPKITVRDFAAMTIARILKLPEEPKPEWSLEQWAGFREKVVGELHR